MYVFQSTLKFLTNWPGPKKENRKYWLTIIGFVFRHLENIFGLLGEILGWANRGLLGTRFPVFLLKPLWPDQIYFHWRNSVFSSELLFLWPCLPSANPTSDQAPKVQKSEEEIWYFEIRKYQHNWFVENIWVSFSRARILAVLCHLLKKNRAYVWLNLMR